MKISRRKFIKAGSVVALIAGSPLKTAVFAAGQENAAEQMDYVPDPQILHESALDLSYLTQSSFLPYLNTKFWIYAKPQKAVGVKLVEVDDLSLSHSDASVAMAGKECFSLVFLGSLRIPLPQDTYRIEHDALGELLLLVVPIGKNEKGLRYEAVINRLYP